MKLKYFPEEWEDIIAHCDFSESELQVISHIRKEEYLKTIAIKLNMDESTVFRRTKTIGAKIVHYLLVKDK